jgi:hypothetical protein
MAEAFKRPPELPTIACVSLTEVLAEKFVALTRRAGAELANAGGPRDPTLVRHVYDLHVTRKHFEPAEVIELAQTIMLADAKTYGHQFPAYRDDPVAETLRAVAGLASDPGFAGRYAPFLRDMVYGEERPEFKIALATITALARQLHPGLERRDE